MRWRLLGFGFAGRTYIFFEGVRPAGSTFYIQHKRVLFSVEPAGPVRANVGILVLLFAGIRREYMARTVEATRRATRERAAI